MTLFIALLAMFIAWAAFLGLISLTLYVGRLRGIIEDLAELHYEAGGPQPGDLGDPITTAQAAFMSEEDKPIDLPRHGHNGCYTPPF